MSLLSSSNKSEGNNSLSTSTADEWRNKMTVKYYANCWEETCAVAQLPLCSQTPGRNPSPAVTAMWSWASSLSSEASVSSFFLNDRPVMRMNVKTSIAETTETFSGVIETIFIIMLKRHLPCFLSLLRAWWRFSEATSCELSQQIECRAEMGIQLSPIKPDIKEIYGNMKVPLLSLNCFIFKNTMIVHKTMLLVLACNGFVNVIFQWVNVKYI